VRVLLATTGSEGDIRPFYALGQKLVAAGHDVKLAAADRWEKRAIALGIPFAAVDPPWNEENVQALFAKILAERNPMKQLVIVLDGLADDQRLSVPPLKELAKDADVVVYPPLFVAAAAAARAVDKPHVSVQFAPVHPSVMYGPTGANWGRPLNRVMWWMAKRMMRRATDARLNGIVREAGLPEWHDILLESASSKLLDLVAVSPSFMPKDPSWGEHIVVTGYWFLDEPTPASAELEAFVKEGDPPAVIGFGSMTGLDAKKTMEIIMGAARGLERRVVVQSGWAGLSAEDVPKNVHVASFVPHAWLFSRAACVVHHGGAGTTAAAMRAGVPQTIVWHLGDQPVWGKRVAEKGLGLPPRSHHDLDAKWLRASIERMTKDEAMKSRAKEMGEALAKEDGLARAVSAIEEAIKA